MYKLSNRCQYIVSFVAETPNRAGYSIDGNIPENFEIALTCIIEEQTVHSVQVGKVYRVYHIDYYDARKAKSEKPEKLHFARVEVDDNRSIPIELQLSHSEMTSDNDIVDLIIKNGKCQHFEIGKITQMLSMYKIRFIDW